MASRLETPLGSIVEFVDVRGQIADLNRYRNYLMKPYSARWKADKRYIEATEAIGQQQAIVKEAKAEACAAQTTDIVKGTKTTVQVALATLKTESDGLHSRLKASMEAFSKFAAPELAKTNAGN